ncbi:MAG: copper-translocating P-type ATPase, partial [Calditrichaeota bacterium]
MAELCTQCGLPLAAGVGARRVRSGAGHFCCYGCLLTYQITQEKGEEGKAQGVLIRLGLGIFFAMNVMLFSLPTYSSYIYNLELTGIDEANFIFFLRIALVVLSLPVLILLGLPILLNSIREISRLTFSVDTLIALGTFSAYAVSIHNTFAQTAHVYFDTVTMLLVLVTLGRYLEARAKVKTSESLTHVLRAEPATYTLMSAEGETAVEPSEIRVGDVLKILPGATIPVDGVVENGRGGVDESSLTGEREPVFKEPGSRVVSGSTSIDGTFLVRAERVESESTLARIAQLLEQAKRSRAGIQRTADRIASFFIPAVALFAVAAFVYWSGRVDVETGLMVALSVLVVSCPCALGIATPIAIWMAFAQGAQRGILLRDGETLEALAKVQSLFFDKTGTLTSGDLSLSDVTLHPDAELSRD